METKIELLGSGSDPDFFYLEGRNPLYLKSRIWVKISRVRNPGLNIHYDEVSEDGPDTW